MKKLLIIFVLCTFVFNTNAQNIKIRKLKKIEVQEKVYFPSYGQNKNEILFTEANYKGLFIYNTRSRELEQISNARSAGEIRILDNDKIIFRTNDIVSGRKISQYMSFQRSNKKVTEIEETALIENQQPEKPVAIVNGKQIDIQINSSGKYSITPFDDSYYLWASLSPDGSKVLFTATTHGTFISDLKGNILYELNNLNAPSWINNSWVAGMNDIDDGERIISSEIIAFCLTNQEFYSLTGKNKIIAMYPKFSPEGNRLAFQSPDGSIYTAKIRIKK